MVTAAKENKSTAMVARPSNTGLVYGNVQATVEFCKEFGESIGALVGCNPLQTKAVALVCMCEGINPLDFQRKYHFIEGKPSMKAAAMLAEFRMNQGGKYRVISNTPEKASLFCTTIDGEEYTVELTRRDLMLSRWPWISEKVGNERKLEHPAGWRNCTKRVRELLAAGKTEQEVWEAMIPYFKDNYGTEADWKNMLMARLTGETMRSIAPEMAAGIYSPEEIQDVIEGEVIASSTEPRLTAAEIAARKAAERATQSTDEAVAASAAEAVVNGGAVAEDGEIDAEFEVVADNHPEAESAESTLTLQVRQLFVDAFGERAPDAIKKSCEGRGVSALRNMSDEQLNTIAERLRQEIRKNQDAAKNA